MLPSRKLFSGLVSLILLVACASPYEPYEGTMWSTIPVPDSLPDLSSEQGRVWFYRTAPRKTWGSWPILLLDGKLVGQANPGRVYFTDASPGAHEVTIGSNKMMITVEKRQHVFVKTQVDSKGIYPTLVDPRISARVLGLDPLDFPETPKFWERDGEPDL